MTEKTTRTMKTLENAFTEVLNESLQDDRYLRNLAESAVDSCIEAVVLRELGVERRYDEWRMARNPPDGFVEIVQEVVMGNAHSIAERCAKVYETLTKKEMAELDKSFKEFYLCKLENAIRDAAAAKAEEDAGRVFAKLVEESPIVREMALLTGAKAPETEET